MDQRQNVKPKTPKRKIEASLYDIGLGKYFLGTTTEVQS